MHRTIRFGFVTMVALILVTFVYFTASAQTPATKEHSMTFDYPGGHPIQMKLAAGEYTVQRSPDNQIHMRWSSTDPKKSPDELKVSFANDQGAAEIRTKHAKGMKVIAQLPSPSDLNIRLAAGELRIEGVEGNKDISLSVGEIRIQVEDPNQYGHVSSSVRLGDVQARAFQGSKSGFWRHFEFNGQGRYSLHATLGIGDVVLSRRVESN